MKNLNLLLSENKRSYPKKLSRFLDRNEFHYIDSSKQFNSVTLRDIVGFLNEIKKRYKNYKYFPINFDFKYKKITVQDKLAFVIFECICYLLRREDIRINLQFNLKMGINTRGIASSPLRFLNTDYINHEENFIKTFETDIYQRHFRKIVFKKDLETNYLGILLQDLCTFLGVFELSDERIKKIAMVIIEIVGNAGEHGETDCLIDIDITEEHEPKKSSEYESGDYYGINIAIVGFSEQLFGEALKNKVTDKNFKSQGRYAEVYKAFINHSETINEILTSKKNNQPILYSEEYFWIIASLQDKISGRKNNYSMGGTGLTILINSLQKEAVNDTCYVISGNKIVYFKKDYIVRNEDNWVGFNKEQDFINKIPDNSIIQTSKLSVPGTAYNLNFIMKRER